MSLNKFSPQTSACGSVLKKHKKGFSLLEVLISLVILAVGLLGMTALQNEALKYNQAAFLESQAMFLIADIAERIRANRDSNTYVIDFIEAVPEAAVNCTTTTCTSSQMTAWDMEEWRNLVQDSAYLPSGESAITHDAITDVYTISVRFEWSQLGGVDITDGKRTVTVTTRI